MKKEDLQKTVHASPSRDHDVEINLETCVLPFCLVWTPIPILTWIFPIIGHLGIGDSTGTISEFISSYHVSTGMFVFGKPTRYLKFNPDSVTTGKKGWDEGIALATDEYRRRRHLLISDNCHSHVAFALNSMPYPTSFNAFYLMFLVFFRAKFFNGKAFIYTFAPSLLFYTLIAFVFIFLFR